eukprot:gene9817-6893_t
MLSDVAVLDVVGGSPPTATTNRPNAINAPLSSMLDEPRVRESLDSLYNTHKHTHTQIFHLLKLRKPEEDPEKTHQRQCQWLSLTFISRISEFSLVSLSYTTVFVVSIVFILFFNISPVSSPLIVSSFSPLSFFPLSHSAGVERHLAAEPSKRNKQTNKPKKEREPERNTNTDSVQTIHSKQIVFIGLCIYIYIIRIRIFQLTFLHPSYRQFTRQHYTTTSERSAGLSHLRHMERLAELALNENRGCCDAPDVNFSNPATMDEIHIRETGTTPQAKYNRAVQLEEQELAKDNRMRIQRLLCHESSSFREARHMNHFPTPEELERFYKVEDQLYFKEKVRIESYKEITRHNRILLRHLYEAKPYTKSAAEMDRWYREVHQKRLQQLSRFRPTECFSGENVLRHRGLQLPLGRRDARGVPVAESEDTRKAGKPPLRYKRALPQPSYEAFARATAAAGKPTYPTPEDEAAVMRGPRPLWRDVNPADVSLINYMNDSALLRPTRTVRKDEENETTKFWRESMGAGSAKKEQEQEAPAGPEEGHPPGARPTTAPHPPPAAQKASPASAHSATGGGCRVPRRHRHPGPFPSYDAFALAAAAHGKPTFPTRVEEEAALLAPPPQNWRDVTVIDQQIFGFMRDAATKRPNTGPKKAGAAPLLTERSYQSDWSWQERPQSPERYPAKAYVPQPFHEYAFPSYEAFAKAAEVHNKPAFPSPADEEAARREKPRAWRHVTGADTRLLHFMNDAAVRRPPRPADPEEEAANHRLKLLHRSPNAPPPPPGGGRLSAGRPPRPPHSANRNTDPTISPRPQPSYGEAGDAPVNARDLPLFRMTLGGDAVHPASSTPSSASPSGVVPQVSFPGPVQESTTSFPLPGQQPPAPAHQGSEGTPPRQPQHSTPCRPPMASSHTVPPQPAAEGRLVPPLPLLDAGAPPPTRQTTPVPLPASKQPHPQEQPHKEPAARSRSQASSPDPSAQHSRHHSPAAAAEDDNLSSSSNSGINIPVASAPTSTAGRGYSRSSAPGGEGAGPHGVTPHPIEWTPSPPHGAATLNGALSPLHRRRSAGEEEWMAAHMAPRRSQVDTAALGEIAGKAAAARAPRTADELLIDALLEEWRAAKVAAKETPFLPLNNNNNNKTTERKRERERESVVRVGRAHEWWAEERISVASPRYTPDNAAGISYLWYLGLCFPSLSLSRSVFPPGSKVPPPFNNSNKKLLSSRLLPPSLFALLSFAM